MGTNRVKLIFQLFFLKKDGKQSVEVSEVEEINFTEVKSRIEHGESVFITSKQMRELNLNPIVNEEVAELRVQLI